MSRPWPWNLPPEPDKNPTGILQNLTEILRESYGNLTGILGNLWRRVAACGDIPDLGLFLTMHHAFCLTEPCGGIQAVAASRICRIPVNFCRIPLGLL